MFSTTVKITQTANISSFQLYSVINKSTKAIILQNLPRQYLCNL